MGIRRSGSKTSTRYRSRKRLLVRVALLATALLLFLVSPAAAEPTITVEAGHGGLHQDGTAVPVLVTVDADRLVDGEVRLSVVSPDGSSKATVVEAEIAGGSSKEFRLVASGVNRFGPGVVVELVEDGEVTATRRVALRSPSDDEIVGVLPSLADDLPVTASLTVDLGVARLSALDPAWLDLGTSAIDTIDIVVAAAPDLRALSPRAITAMQGWLEAGGTLVIDEPAGTPIGEFDVVLGAIGEPVTVGRGRMISSGGAAAAGEWDELLSPTSVRAFSAEGGFAGELTGDVIWFGEPVEVSLAEDAGFELPSLPWVLVLLLAYVIIGGPLIWLILRRMDRTGLMWAALPALALLFTGAIWVAGSDLRSGADDAHGTIIEIRDNSATATTTHLLSSRSSGVSTFDLPVGWEDASSTSNQFGFRPGSTSNRTTIRQGNPVTIEAELDSGGFMIATASGPVDQYAGGLEITAESARNGNISGTITNHLDFDVAEVVVFAETAADEVGTIAAGETIDFTVNGRPVNPRFGEPVEFRVWREATNRGFVEFGPFGPVNSTEPNESPVNISLWAQYLGANGGSARPLGEVVVAAWTRDQPAPTDASIEKGRTLLVARESIDAVTDVWTDVSISRHMIRTPDELPGGQGNFGPNFTVGSAWRFDLPAGVDPTTLALETPAVTEGLELFIDGEWVDIGDDVHGEFMQLDPSAVSNGSVWVKLFINFDRGAGIDRDFSVQSIGAAGAINFADALAPEEEE